MQQIYLILVYTLYASVEKHVINENMVMLEWKRSGTCEKERILLLSDKRASKCSI